MDLKIKPSGVLSQTVAVLRQALLEGRFKPGERLVEADLCARLGVSRPSVREALRRLEAERLVELVPNRGPVVPVLPWEDALQIYETRRLLEGEAAALAARNAGADDHRRLREALALFQRAVRECDAAGQIASTRQFYDALLRGGGNRIIQEVLEGLHARISVLRSRSMSQPGRNVHSHAEMVAIAAAVIEGDEVAARQAAMHHIQRACEAARDAYARLDPPSPD